MTPTVPDLLQRLEAAYPDFGPQLQLAAKYVVDHPDEIALHSMREIARRCDVAPSTLLRVAQYLEFDTYDAFRAPFRDAIRAPGTAFRDRAALLQSLDDDTARHRPNLLSGMASATLGNVEQMIQDLDAAEIHKAAQAIIAARRVYVLGLRGSLGLAHYLFYVARMVRGDVYLPTGLASEAYEDLLDVGPDDVLIAFAFAPYTEDTVRSTEHVLSRGARVVAITDSRLSPITSGAAFKLLAPTESPQFFPSFTAATALVETLLASLVAAGGPSALDHIAEFDAFRTNYRSYWKGGDPK